MRTRLHDRTMMVNFANPYPRAVRRYPNYNAPQVELVLQAADATGDRLVVVDVGAAIGDTAALILSRAVNRIEQLHCVEGEADFAALLRKNFPEPPVVIHETLLSDHPGPIQALHRVEHEGTASPVGATIEDATTLDNLFPSDFAHVLKVDTDGFDGVILAGATELITRARPAVLFEWHPRLYRNVGADPMQPFELLRIAGYNRWIWFTKYGQFSHFGDCGLQDLEELCLTSGTLPDWHYDVAALHRDSQINYLSLAGLSQWGSSGYS